MHCRHWRHWGKLVFSLECCRALANVTVLLWLFSSFQKRPTRWERYFSMSFRWHASKNVVHVRFIKGMALTIPFRQFESIFNFFLCFNFNFFFIFCFHFIPIPPAHIPHTTKWRSLKPICPLEFYRTEPFISYPLLSAIRKHEFLFARSSGKFLQQNDWNADNRNDAIDDGSSEYESNDFTIDKSNPMNGIDHRLRLASIGLLAKNLFKDIVIRPISGFAKMVHTAKSVWDSQKT